MNNNFKRQGVIVSVGTAVLTWVIGVSTAHAIGFDLTNIGGYNAAAYTVIFQGGGGDALNINAGPALVSGMAVNGNVGIAGTGTFNPSGGGGVVLVSGNVDFAGTANAFSSSYVGGSINSSVTGLQNVMNALNSLSTTLGGEAGTSIALSSGMTINVNVATPLTGGTLDGTGNAVFNVTSVNLPNGTLTINGDGTHNVVFNISASANFHANQIVLTGGLTSDQVLFNFYGGNSGTLSGGPTLDVNSGGGSPSHTDYILYGTFLDPYGSINLSDTQLYGRLYGGDTHNEQIVSGGYISAPTLSVPDNSSTFVLLGLALGFLGCAGCKFQAHQAPASARQ